ncbi:MAG: endonuclease V [Candidatus Sericytochromatia bacterium]
MTRPELHGWDLDWSHSTALQNALASQLVHTVPAGPIRRVAGVDVSYAQDSDLLVAGVVVLDAESLQPLEQHTWVGKARVPYVPGFLSFREVPPLLEVLNKLSAPPDLIVCDGQGIAHPRKLGVASHLGLWVQIPTIGCAKSPLIRSPQPGENRGDRAEVKLRGEVVGYSLRTRTGYKPLYVSPGHLTTLDFSAEWVLKLTPKWRQAETTRAADHLVGETMRALRQAESPPDAE